MSVAFSPSEEVGMAVLPCPPARPGGLAGLQGINQGGGWGGAGSFFTSEATA